MPLMTTKPMFDLAYEGGFAVGAFNVNNMELAQSIIDACARLAQIFGFSRASARPVAREDRRPTAARHPFLAVLTEVAKAVEQRAKPRESPFRREVEARIEPLLASGRPRIEEVARELGLSRQTLYRRLKAEGATFETVLDRLRRRLALRMIREAPWELPRSWPRACCSISVTS